MRACVLLLLVGCGSSTTTRSAPSPAAPGPASAAPAPAPAEDPYLWLEEVGGEKALAWARERNAVSQGELEKDPGFAPLRDRLRRIYDSRERIPVVVELGRWLYNFWQDDAHPRGLWRRTTWAEYRKRAPRWETVIDLDALAIADGKSWVWDGATCLYPRYERCLVRLSPGGSDAVEVREFDARSKSFVAGGFTLPEAKSVVEWKDLDTVYVGTDLGPGSLTESGYPRLAREWRRGTPIGEARQLFEADAKDVIVTAVRAFDKRGHTDWIYRYPEFFRTTVWLREGDRNIAIDKPDDAEMAPWHDQLLFTLRSDWTVGGRTWPGGALLAIRRSEFLAGKRDFTMLYRPQPTTSLAEWVGTRSSVLVVELDDVKSRLYLHTPRANGAGWTRTPVAAPDVGSIAIAAVDEHDSDDYFLIVSGFTSPKTLALAGVGRKGREVLKTDPAFFRADGLEATQHFVASKDGTRVPYFQVSRGGLALDGSAPTVLYGYGGFEVAQTPHYDATSGAGWLENGGVLAVANVRGGGEYGPRWHQAALKQNRQRAFDDFAAVAEDLIARKVTSPAKLGIVGESNGGLLVGVMLVQRPELFGAVVCAVPLLDMKRYHKLLAGASWMSEFGNPDVPEEWAALARYSPYQNLRSGTSYPRTLFVSSTRDDRVHPGHARKMVARMRELGAEVLYYENMEGGHAGAANHEQKAQLWALSWTFFRRQLGL